MTFSLHPAYFFPQKPHYIMFENDIQPEFITVVYHGCYAYLLSFYAFAGFRFNFYQFTKNKREVFKKFGPKLRFYQELMIFVHFHI